MLVIGIIACQSRRKLSETAVGRARKMGERLMRKKATPERLGAFSDGVIAVIITIMVLELKAPHTASPGALLALWPTFASYALSYLFVGTVWINHHHLLRYTDTATPAVIWSNLACLFTVSLIPFFTAYMAENRMAPFTTAMYAAEFLLVSITFHIFQLSITGQFENDPELEAKAEAGSRKNLTAMSLYTLAIPAAYLHPSVSFALIFGVGVMYFFPEAKAKRDTQGGGVIS